MSIKQEKAVLRKSLMGRDFGLVNMPAIEQDLYSLLSQNITFKRGQIVAGYYPTKNEFDIRHILKTLSPQHIIALPVTNGRDKPLSFRRWNMDKESLESNQFNIQEPKLTAEEVIPDIMIVPCVGLSRTGYRVGYGFGYYDRTINQLRNDGHNVLTIGVGYSHQLLPEMPVDKHDAQLDWVITNTKAFKCR